MDAGSLGGRRAWIAPAGASSTYVHPFAAERSGDILVATDGIDDDAGTGRRAQATGDPSRLQAFLTAR